MEWKINPNAVNQLAKGTEIYTEGDPVFSIALILKGRVMLQNEGAKVVLSTGTFLGVNDLYTGRFQSTYTACEDVLLYVYAISGEEELEGILSINKDYHGFMVASYNKLIFELDNIYQGALKNSTEIYQFLTDYYKEYADIKGIGGNKAAAKRYNSFTIPETDIGLLRGSINYYMECRNLPIDVVKAFYSYGNAITIYQVEDQVNIINEQIEALRMLSGGLISLAEGLIDDSETCLFHLVAANALEIDKTGGSTGAMDVLDNIIDEVNKAEKFIDRMTGSKLAVNRKKMEEIYHLLLTGAHAADINSQVQSEYSAEETEQALNELRNSFQKILEYAEIADDQAMEMQSTMLEFVNLKDKTSTEDDTRIIRRKLTDFHYQLYKSVFLKEYANKDATRVIELFLKYGFADEKLLTKDQLISLYYLKEDNGSSLCNVYNIKDWLTLIYEGKKEPSKNEFDLEYTEMVTGLRKQAKLTEKEAKEWLINSERKLEYEIQNMFRYNNRVTNGQITVFVPILHKDNLLNKPDKLQVTAAKVNEAVAELLKIDYSIFHREILYVNKERNIEKEYIVKKIYPDIILMPTVGNNSVMWQEIAGKRRDSAGRFLLPIFTDTSLNSHLVKLFGRFRWELCRSIEGVSWNDIKHKSLTSEYSDYLQFYRKNKDLSEETKERVKHQIQKGRNNSREIFVIDYEQWINYEAIGAVKLNKLVRELLATYCPFAKPIREQIKLQPIFEDAMRRYYRDKQKKIRETESRFRLLLKDQINLTKELEDTLIYYKDL